MQVGAGPRFEAVALPRQTWGGNFRVAGHSDSAIAASCEMFDKFNDGRVAFEGDHTTRHGHVGLTSAPIP